MPLDNAKLVEEANALINEMINRKLTQIEIARLIGTSATTLSKLKSEIYFPKNGEILVKKLDSLNKKLTTSPKDAIAPLFTKDQPHTIKPYYVYLIMVIILMLGIGVFIGSYLGPLRSKMDTNDVTISEAFNTIFESNMQSSPYSNNVKLPCYKYQKKWEIYPDTPYTITLPLLDGNYYYRAKTVDLYAWCKTGNEKGDSLEAFELFTNELWIDTKARANMDVLKYIDFENDEDFQKVAEVSSIFSDIIGFKYSPQKKDHEPHSREAKRISRYYKTFVSGKEKAEAINIIENYIFLLSQTRCDSVSVINNKSDSTNRHFILEFDCIFFSNDDDDFPSQPYKKKIIQRK